MEDRKRSFLRDRKEALYILLTWAICLVWTLGYCSWDGYRTVEDGFEMTLGIPRWIFWGVLVPWILASGFTFWFALFYMADSMADDQSEE